MWRRALPAAPKAAQQEPPSCAGKSPSTRIRFVCAAKGQPFQIRPAFLLPLRAVLLLLRRPRGYACWDLTELQRCQETEKPSSNLAEQNGARRAEEANSPRTDHGELPVGDAQLNRGSDEPIYFEQCIFCMLPTRVERLHPPVVMMLLILHLRISRSQAILSCSEEISLLCIGAPEGRKGQDFITPFRPMCLAIWPLAMAPTMAALDIEPNANNCIPLRHEVTQQFLSKKSKQSKHGGSSQSRGDGPGRRRGRLVEVADHGVLGGRGEAAGEAGLDQAGGDDEGAEERNIAMEEAPTELLSCFRLRA